MWRQTASDFTQMGQEQWEVSIQDFNFLSFLGAFTKIPKATIKFLMSVRPSVRMEQIGPQ